MSGSFVDIHAHVLPGLDDGPEELDEAIALCRAFADQGVQTVVATPHQSSLYAHNTNTAIRNAVARLHLALQENDVQLELLPGADSRIDADVFARWEANELMTLADGGKYLLLELPHELAFPLGELASAFREAGVVPILSHPERNAGVLRKPACLRHWVDAGLVLQITMDSLLGYWGKPALRTAGWILEQRLGAVLASDAHSVTGRPPRHRKAWDEVSRRWGEATARRLMIDVPRSMTAAWSTNVDVPTP